MDGTLWAFGRNDDGRLGLGDQANRSSPTQVGNLSSWVELAINNSQSTIARTGPTRFTLWGTGWNEYGQLGVGDTIHRSSPVQIGNLSQWAKIAAGRHHTLGRHIDRTLWSFGRNAYGELGLGDTLNRSSPVQLGNLSQWIEIASGEYHKIIRR